LRAGAELSLWRLRHAKRCQWYDMVDIVSSSFGRYGQKARLVLSVLEEERSGGMATTAQDIDRKLCLTAAVVGAVTRKDLAAAFRRVNPATSFDVERAHKWLQGRARPRESSIYEDWATLLDLGEPGTWIAECGFDRFLDRLCRRHGQERGALLRRAEAFAGIGTWDVADTGGETELLGSYACYSHAWSPYFGGRLIRGTLTVAIKAKRLTASYVEALPNGRLAIEGGVTRARHGLQLDLRDPHGAAHLLFCLFTPSPPVSVLSGLMCGMTILGPEPCPSVTRIVMVRKPVQDAALPKQDAYLPAGTSIALDLHAQGLLLDDPGQADRLLATFLNSGSANGLDQLSSAHHRALVELFDRAWITRSGMPA
jgi:hypothetical protein